MSTHCNFYIDGQWVEPAGTHTVHAAVSPGDESVVGQVMMGGQEDVNRAVMAARRSFDSFSHCIWDIMKFQIQKNNKYYNLLLQVILTLKIYS